MHFIKNQVLHRLNQSNISLTFQASSPQQKETTSEMKSIPVKMLGALIILALCLSQTNATTATFIPPAWWLCPYCSCEPEAPDDGDLAARPLRSTIDGNTHENQALDSLSTGSSSTTRDYGTRLQELREQHDDLPQIPQIVA